VIKRILLLDGVVAVCRFRDDGAFVEGYGQMPEPELQALAHFAHDYKRIVQGNADQLAMFTNQRGWTPPGGWIVRGRGMSVCSVANLVCVIDNREAAINAVMHDLGEAATY